MKCSFFEVLKIIDLQAVTETGLAAKIFRRQWFSSIIHSLSKIHINNLDEGNRGTGLKCPCNGKGPASEKCALLHY